MKRLVMSRGRTGAAVVAIVGCLLAVAFAPDPADGAAFPQKGKAIQILMGFAAGGSTDAGARILASGMEKELGTPVVVVNKPGAPQRGGWRLAGAPG